MEENETIKNQMMIGEEKSEAIAHKNLSLKRLDISFNKHIEIQEYKKTHLLAYWINDFAEYHDNEVTFNSSSLKTFKRGDIIKVNLGFNIGNELGGLHYCVVLNKKDNPYSGTLNVIPLSSAKTDKQFNSYTTVELGDELYNSLYTKFENEFSKTQDALKLLLEEHNIELSKKVSKNIEYLEKVKEEISKMKHGSFALINQITTISKQRIFKTPILSGIKLSNNGLDLIDSKIKRLFTK